MSKPYLLEVQGLVKIYSRRTVVDQVQYHVNAGEVVGLLGPNGAGKTTSFRMTVGLIRPDAGHILLEGRNITKLPMFQRARLGMGYLSQEPSIFQKMTVSQNILSILEMRGIGKKERRNMAKLALEQMKIAHLSQSRASNLSGGERRRLEIARAMVTHPKLILLDEPFSGVDPIAVAEIQEIILNLRNQGIGILLTDHNVRETLAITDRAYILGNGKIWVHGTSQELIEDPRARAVYLGEKFSMQGVEIQAGCGGTFLSTVRAYKEQEVLAMQQSHAREDLQRKAAKANTQPVRDFEAALRAQGIGVIAEIKKASPSAGLIRNDFDPTALAQAYEQGGARALSVLTDAPSFQGDLQHLTDARTATTIPVLRKEFIIDPLQIYEARAASADAILLIVNMLADPQLQELLDLTHHLGMQALVEVHNQDELHRALHTTGCRIIGINNRDLHTLKVRMDTSFQLRRNIPDEYVTVAESGISDHETLMRMEDAGFDAVLVGESLLRQQNVASAIRHLAGGPKGAKDAPKSPVRSQVGQGPPPG